MNEEQQIKDRKRNIIVLIERYLLNCGFLETVTKLEQESNISLGQ